MLQDIANHLWQSTLFLMLIAVLCTYLRKEDARVRYALWCIGSMKFLLPFSLLTSIGSWLSPRAPIESIDLTIDWVASVSAVSQPFTPQQQSWSVSSMILAVWAVGSFLVLGVWAVRAYRLRQLIRGAKQESKPLSDQGRVIPVYRTQADIEPGVFGLLRPVILLPQGIENRLSTTQFEAVLAHELCHIRRRDNLTAAVHMLVQAVFWFHPIIWWVGSRLIDERERACDELVVSLGHDREAYAKSILDVCEQYVATRLACAPGISGSDLKRRVVEIMHYEGVKKMENTKKILLSTLSALVLALPILGGLFVNSGALAQEMRPLSEQTASVLKPIREALSPEPAADGSKADPNPQLALNLLDDINIDALPGFEKAEVYFLFGFAYYMVEDLDQVKNYWRRVINEPDANTSLATRTLKNLAQVHFVDEEYSEALDYYLEWMSRQERANASDYALLANIYYSTEDYPNSLINIDRAIGMREEIGEAGEERWYEIRNTVNYLLGNSATVENQQHSDARPRVSGSEYALELRPINAALVQPLYPQNARDRGLEGYCVVSFVITATGETRDARKEECTNAIFEAESLRAAERLKYPPVNVIIPNARGGAEMPTEIKYWYKFTYEMPSETI